MDFKKKCWIGSGLQNFHIRTPLDCASEMSGLSYFAIQTFPLTQSNSSLDPNFMKQFTSRIQIQENSS